MRTTIAALATIALGATLLTGCAPAPGHSDRIQTAVPATPHPSITSPTAVPTTPITASPSATPSPTPSAAHTSTPKPPVSHVETYAHPLVLPTCDTITAAPGHTPYVVTSGMDYVVPASAGVYGINISSLQSLVHSRHGISCTWLDHYSKRFVTITTTIITTADRSTIRSALTAAGWTHSEFSEQFWAYTPGAAGTLAREMCAWPLNEHAAAHDYWVCIDDTTGESFGASVQDAEDAFLYLNPVTAH
jgi:predicted small secreted protein